MNTIILLLSLILAWLVGLLAFHAGPLLQGALGRGKHFARFTLWLALFAGRRLTIVVEEDGELLWKKLGYDPAVGAEKVGLGDRTKLFADPDDALTTWGPAKFALTDEPHGVCFDPRHAIIGRIKESFRDRGEWVAKATDADWSSHGVYAWIRGAIEIDDVHEIAKLEGVRNLATGNERAEEHEHAEEFYRLSVNPNPDGMGTLRLLIPPAVFIGVLVAFWQMGSMGGGGGGGGGGGTVVEGPGNVLLAAVSLEWARRHGRALLAASLLSAFVALLAVVAGPLFVITCAIAFALGFVTVPAWAILLGLLGVGGMLSKLLLFLAFMGFDRPVLEWTPEGYRLREFEEFEDAREISWYRLAATPIGFTFQPGEGSFGPDVMDPVELEARVPAKPGGGHVPRGHYRAGWLTRGQYGAFLPAEYDSGVVYLNSAIAQARLDGGWEGEVTDRTVQEAKEKYGDGNFGLGDRALLYAVMGAIALAAPIGWFGFL